MRRSARRSWPSQRASGLTVTAEGVEEPAQLEVLRERGCRLIQGNLVSPAVPASAIPALVQKNGGR